MKHFLLNLSFLLIGIIGYSQGDITVGVYQDGKLATTTDKYGNKPFTLDGRIEVMLQGDNGDNAIGHMEIGVLCEYADLSEFNFIRYGVQGGYNFTYIPTPWYNKYLHLTVLAGYGWISRDNGHEIDGDGSIELTTELGYFITRWLSVNAKGVLTQRSDLTDYELDKVTPWKPSLFIGLKFKIINNKN